MEKSIFLLILFHVNKELSLSPGQNFSINVGGHDRGARRIYPVTGNGAISLEQRVVGCGAVCH